MAVLPRAALFFYLVLLSLFLQASADRKRATLTAKPSVASGLPVIKIGRTVSLSGIYQQESLAVYNGIHFWWEVLQNTSGGVINTTFGPIALELIEYNDASDPENVKLLYRDLVFFDNITAAFGPWTTQLSIPAIQQTAADGIPFVFSGGSAPVFYTSGYQHSFGLLVLSGKRSQPCMALLAEQGVKTAVIVASTDSFQQTVLSLLSSQAKALNISVLFNVTVDKSGNEDLTELVDAIGKADPDVVLSAQETPNFQPFVQLLRELLLDGVPRAVYNSNSATVSIAYASIGWPADLVFGGDQWSPLLQFDDPLFGNTAGFVAAYAARFNYTPSFVDAASVAAGFAMQRALETAASFDAADIIAALRAYRNPTTFFGPIAFLPSGELNSTGICTQLLPSPYPIMQRVTDDRQLYPVAPSSVKVANATYPAVPIRPLGPKLSPRQVKLVIAFSAVGGVLVIGLFLALAWFLFRRKFEVVFFPKTKGEDKW